MTDIHLSASGPPKTVLDLEPPEALRGLDRLRANGWRGSGYVRWDHEPNRGFLRALAGLQRTAAAIREDDEAERCALFLRQLDPVWPPAALA